MSLPCLTPTPLRGWWLGKAFCLACRTFAYPWLGRLGNIITNLKDDPMKLKSIPRSLIDLLGQRWQAPSSYSSFHSNFSDNDRDRQARPSRYIHRPDTSRYVNGLKHAEVRALVADGVLTNDWRGHGDAIAINEHQQHALCDFCSEVYDAWDKFQARAEMARNANTRECV